MENLEKMRLKMELLKVQAARAEMEFRIEERLIDIERIKEHIKVQETKELELIEKLK